MRCAPAHLPNAVPSAVEHTMPFDNVTINFARAVLHYDKQQLDDGQHTATAARRSLPMFLVYKGVVVDRCRVLLCFSYHFICYFTYLRSPCYLVLVLLPAFLLSVVFLVVQSN